MSGLTDSQLAEKSLAGTSYGDAVDAGSLQPGAWDNFGTAVAKAPVAGVAAVVRAASVAASVPLLASEGVNNFYTGANDHSASDRYFAGVDFIHNSADQFTPDAATTGKAGQIAHGLIKGLLPLAMGPEALVGTAGLDTATTDISQGLDAKMAVPHALLEATAAGVGFKLPVLGGNLFTRVATGVAGNVALADTSTAATHALLEAGGYHKQAQNYAPGDLTSNIIAGAQGFVFGGAHHVSVIRAEAKLLAGTQSPKPGDQIKMNPVDGFVTTSQLTDHVATRIATLEAKASETYPAEPIFDDKGNVTGQKPPVAKLRTITDAEKAELDFLKKHQDKPDTLAKAFNVAIDDTPAATPSQRDAVLTLANAEHYQQGTMPGEPLTHQAVAEHTDNMDSAFQSLLHGEPVNVPHPFDMTHYRARADLVPDTSQDYPAFRHALESNGNPNAANPHSTAVGIDQFTAPTWLATVKQSSPTWAKGLDDAQLLALRTDPAKSTEMAEHLDAQNTAYLKNHGVPVDNYSLYSAWHFGPAHAVEFARASGDTPMSEILTPAQMDSNPYLKGKTKAEAVANWNQRAAKSGVRLAFADPDRATSDKFVTTAAEQGIPESTARLIAPAAPRDSVTGFFDGRMDAVKTDLLTRAQEHVQATGESAHYVSADLFNLGGLNNHVGNRAEVANVHYREMAQVLVTELRATGADVVPLRTGGDEFGAVVVNAAGPAVQSAVDRAHVKISEYAKENGLADIPHHKRLGEYGVGVHVGVAEITPSHSIHDILNRADAGVNQSKQGSSEHVASRTSRKDGAVAPGRQARGTGSGEPASNRSVRQQDAATEGAPAGPSEPSRPQGEVTPASAAIREAQTVTTEHPDLVVMDEAGNAVRASELLARGEAEIQAAAADAQALEAIVNCALRNPG